ncbi:MAG: hypothetical protein SNG97_07095, partial [Rikenellaceae bacterium]
PAAPCPISSVQGGYPVNIKKKKNNSKTEYDIDIETLDGPEAVTIEELTALMAAPRIPEVINRYSRYHYEATIEFLRQCDERFDMNIMETEVMKEAIEKLGAEIPADDKSSFSFDKRTKDAKENQAELTLDDLFTRYEELQEVGKGDKSDEGQELRAMIRTFIQQEKLDKEVRITRHTTNSDLLNMIEASYASGPAEDADGEPEESIEAVDEETGEVTTQRRRR